MSVNISLSSIDTVDSESLLDSILDGSFQLQAEKDVPELLAELEKYGPQTDKEIYTPHTEAEKEHILNRLKRRHLIQTELKKYTYIPNYIDDVNTSSNDPGGEEFIHMVQSLADNIVSLNGISFYSPLWDVQVCIDLVFKHTGYKPEDSEALEEISYEIWKHAFGSLNRDVLSKIKDEIDADPGEHGDFDYFVETLKDVLDIFRTTDGERKIFSVTVEGEGTRIFEKTLEHKIKEHLKLKPIRLINPEGRGVYNSLLDD